MAVLISPFHTFVDPAGNRVTDARVKVYQAGTTTPARVYIDPSFGTPHPFPVLSRANGTPPIIYVPPGSYDIRVTDPFGAVYDQIEGYVIEETSEGGGGGPGDIDLTALASTGDEKARYGRGTIPGWVRQNGRTIGSAGSAATERANDDCHDLFVHLWNEDPNLAVAGGRGPNAESDWAANKTIAIPDMRGRFSGGLDDMGNAPAGRLAGGLFTFGTATTLGAYGGGASTTLAVANLPSYSLAATASMDAQGAHVHTITINGVGDHAHAIPYQRLTGYGGGGGLGATNTVGQGNATDTGGTSGAGAHTHTALIDSAGLHSHTVTVSVASGGSGTPLSTVPPFLLKTFYLKL